MTNEIAAEITGCPFIPPALHECMLTKLQWFGKVLVGKVLKGLHPHAALNFLSYTLIW